MAEKERKKQEKKRLIEEEEAADRSRFEEDKRRMEEEKREDIARNIKLVCDDLILGFQRHCHFLYSMYLKCQTYPR